MEDFTNGNLRDEKQQLCEAKKPRFLLRPEIKGGYLHSALFMFDNVA